MQFDCNVNVYGDRQPFGREQSSSGVSRSAG
jgi:hypothetical protein